jgi:hypothetical protein
MTNLRDLAEGRPCLVRVPECNGGGATTVLAHYRLAGYSGNGLKPPDVMGAHACSSCHDVIDGRKHIEGWPRERVRLAHAEGVMRTIAALHDEGHIWTD